MGRGAAASRATGSPVCLAVSVGAFRKWLRAAKPGAEFTYAVGRVLDRQHRVAQAAQDAQAAGDVVLSQRRRPDGDLDYLARRVASAKPSAAPAAKSREIDPDAAEVLRLISARADASRPCPTNRDIAVLLRLDSAERARYLIGQLERDGLIAVKNRGPRVTRVITIHSTGKRTCESATPVGRGFVHGGSK